MKIEVIFEDNHLLAVVKPVGIPVQKDNSEKEDLQTILKEYLKKKYGKPGEAYLGIVHRLDQPVGGVMVFAKTSKAAARLSEQIRKNEWR
ncbi:MAG TPA: pseudouridine synthase, partial [bacterium]|nr:pseudouridine synthase [bacterium]